MSAAKFLQSRFVVAHPLIAALIEVHCNKLSFHVFTCPPGTASESWVRVCVRARARALPTVSPQSAQRNRRPHCARRVHIGRRSGREPAAVVFRPGSVCPGISLLPQRLSPRRPRPSSSARRSARVLICVPWLTATSSTATFIITSLVLSHRLVSRQPTADVHTTGVI